MYINDDNYVNIEDKHECDDEQASFTPGQALTGPDRPPGRFGDQALIVFIEGRLVGFGPVNMICAQNRAPHRHAGVMFVISQEHSPK